MKLTGRLTGWFRGRSLRSRLAMLTAAAVAVAIALSALACWFIVRDRLYQQARDSLRGAPIVSGGPGDHRQQLVACGTTPQAAAESAAKEAAAVEATQTNLPPFGSRTPWVSQLVSTDGTICTPLSTSAKGIVVEPSDLRLLGQPPNKSTYRVGSFTGKGEPAMVRVSSVTLTVHNPTTQQDTTGDYVLLTATSLQDTQDSLRDLAFTLLGVAALGVVGAGFTGRIVARSALRPVDQLTDAVEHIARTEEVGTTIPVHGKDEIARLSTSFNSMSTALLNSRERQTRLIADAGHELRTPLTSLRTNVDLLIRSDDTGRPLPTATKTKLLGNMKAQMQELTLLIGDLLELSRPDSPSRTGSSPWWRCTRSPSGRWSGPGCAGPAWPST
ncbi:hypothetical protein GCM10025734_47980 [Kitasatospora paranensis]|uniref:histidine kinase dimerization/phospho-acceptor domain-containing protein n=1 Tax=Kitasatospora paranensis TaxID=258053 RepID=UPI0033814778